ncbi:hypothetical protein MKX47_21095 [Solibacillus sp. FSL R7-0668]|uniref:hypothetical protein n=1 Tax=Solibacillus sp. FSL R7-0668 TaxID=2921688 RepID=UPI0030F8D6FC
MVKKYVVLNNDNTVNGFYNDDINKIPTDAIEISEELHQQYYNFNAYKKVLVNGEWIEGLTQEEIDDFNANNPIIQPSELELLKQQLTSQQAIIDELLFEVIPSLLPTTD